MKPVKPILLGVNIDHIATIRQARKTRYPDPVLAALEAEHAGADGITLHLREDRRHIQERDVAILKDTLLTRMNLEMAITEEMLAIAERYKPVNCCFVPEKREELTTEGGLNVAGQLNKVKEACARLASAGIAVSLFIEPDQKQIEAAFECQAPVIELHTGAFADATTEQDAEREFERIKTAIDFAKQSSLIINAGHGLNYQNVKPIAALPEINELNIGHGLVARALFVGFSEAVKEMRQLMLEARSL